MDESVPVRKLLTDVISDTHWLTIMKCTVCDITPDEAPIYKCQNGHPICVSCYRGGFVNDHAPTCNVCSSYYFKKQDVSTEFLRKLKTKPGIGRPRRFALPKDLPNPSSCRAIIPRPDVTVDSLFRMPLESVHQLMQNKLEDRLQFLAYLSSETGVPVDQIPGKFRTNSKFAPISPRTNNKPKNNSCVALKYISTPKMSYQPYRCVDDRCGKVVAKKSFSQHYHYEHHELPQHLYVHTTELTIPFDISWIDYGKTICVGLLRLVTHSDVAAAMSKQQLNATFKHENLPEAWLMVSGSAARPDTGESHLLCWVFANITEEDSCKMTIELASHDDILSVAAYCSVNTLESAQNFLKHPKLINSLYVNYRTLKRLVAFGPEVKLRLTIH